MRGIRTALFLLTALGLASGSAWAAPRKARPPISQERQPVIVEDKDEEGSDTASTASESSPSASSSSRTPSSASKASGSAVSGPPMPPGTSLSQGYVTQIKGDVVNSSANGSPQGQSSFPADDSEPVIVVHAVRVDADGNPLAPPSPAGPTPGTPALATDEPNLSAEGEATDNTAAQDEDSGGFFDFLFGSDEEPEQPPEEKAPVEEPMPFPDLSPASRNLRLGELVTMDEEGDFGVVWLDSRYLAFFGDELVLSRDADLNVTGAMQLTTLRNGKAVGLQRLTGEPKRGDEIILPGPQYTDTVNELYASGQIVPNQRQASPQ